MTWIICYGVFFIIMLAALIADVCLLRRLKKLNGESFDAGLILQLVFFLVQISISAMVIIVFMLWGQIEVFAKELSILHGRFISTWFIVFLMSCRLYLLMKEIIQICSGCERLPDEVVNTLSKELKIDFYIFSAVTIIQCVLVIIGVITKVIVI